MMSLMAVLGAVKFESEAAARAHLEKIWQRRAEDRRIVAALRLKKERALLKKALRRVETAKRWAAMGEEVDERWLWLETCYDMILLEEEVMQANRDREIVRKALGAP